MKISQYFSCLSLLFSIRFFRAAWAKRNMFFAILSRMAEPVWVFRPLEIHPCRARRDKSGRPQNADARLKTHRPPRQVRPAIVFPASKSETVWRTFSTSLLVHSP